jgi:hypothetical protein
MDIGEEHKDMGRESVFLLIFQKYLVMFFAFLAYQQITTQTLSKEANTCKESQDISRLVRKQRFCFLILADFF